MVYVEWFNYDNEKWCLSKMNIFKALFCVLFDRYLGCSIVSKRKIEYF